jgi:hypothetical protein
VAVGLLAFCALAGGCTSSDEAAEPPPEDQFPSEFARAICDSFGACCSSSHFTFDATSCKSTFTSLAQLDIRTRRSPNMVYDVAAAGDCLTQLKKALRCGDAGSFEIPACDHIFTGTLAVGQPCTTSDECKRPAVCTLDVADTNNPNQQKVCLAFPASPPKAGRAGDTCNASCLSPSDDCTVPVPNPGAPSVPIVCYASDGLHCADALTTRHCGPLVDVGDLCAFDGDCKAGLFCQEARCKAPLPNGGACLANHYCQSNYCANSTICATASVTQTDCAKGIR